MKGFRNCLRRARKRPGLFLFLAVVTFIATFIEQYNPWTQANASFGFFKNFDYIAILNGFVHSTIDFFKSPKVAFLTIGAAILIIFALCVVLGLLFSGYFNQLSNATFDKPKKRGEYRVGIGRYTFKLAFYFFISIILTALVVIAVLYSAIPAIMSVKQFFLGSAGMLLPTILLCFVTAVAVFFAVMFYALYVTYILPSIICFRRGGTGVAFRMVNGYCWYLLPRTLAYFIVMLGIRVLLWAVHYGLASTSAAICILVASWMIRTIVNFVYFYFVFNAYSAMKGDMFDSE